MKVKNKQYNNALYTVYKTKSKTDITKTGSFHFSDDGEYTLCGKLLDDNWYISDNTFSGEASCIECLKIIDKVPLWLRDEYRNTKPCKDCQFSNCELGECFNFVSCGDNIKDCKKPCSKCLCWTGYGDTKEFPVINILKNKFK